MGVTKPWQTLGISFAMTPLVHLHQSPPSPISFNFFDVIFVTRYYNRHTVFTLLGHQERLQKVRSNEVVCRILGAFPRLNFYVGSLIHINSRTYTGDPARVLLYFIFYYLGFKNAIWPKCYLPFCSFVCV